LRYPVKLGYLIGIEVIMTSLGKRRMLQTYNFDLILPDLKATNTKQVFKDLAKAISKKANLGEQQLLIKLVSQEKQENISIGQGIAMPHLKISNIDQPMVIFARLKNFVPFETVDNEPIDLICCILSSKEDNVVNLQASSTMARMLSQKEFSERIRSANNTDDIYKIMRQFAPMRKAA